MTLLFLIISTYCWFNLREKDIYKTYQPENIQISKPIVFDSLEKVSDEKIETIDGYEFTISNQGANTKNVKIMVVGDLLTDNVSNNYIKYSINNTEVRSLNIDGIISVFDILESETKNINLKIWISESYSGNLNYNGRVIVS